MNTEEAVRVVKEFKRQYDALNKVNDRLSELDDFDDQKNGKQIEIKELKDKVETLKKDVALEQQRLTVVKSSVNVAKDNLVEITKASNSRATEIMSKAQLEYDILKRAARDEVDKIYHKHSREMLRHKKNYDELRKQELLVKEQLEILTTELSRIKGLFSNE